MTIGIFKKKFLLDTAEKNEKHWNYIIEFGYYNYTHVLLTAFRLKIREKLQTQNWHSKNGANGYFVVTGYEFILTAEAQYIAPPCVKSLLELSAH